MQWARDFGIAATERDTAKLRALRTGLLAARTHPDVSAEDLRLLADWCTWFFRHDDPHDDLCDERPEAVEARRAALKDVIHGARRPSPGMESALLDLWRRTVDAAAPGWAERLRENLGVFLDSKVWEARLRHEGRVPAVETYLARRPAASGMYVYIDLIEASRRHWLDPQTWRALYRLRVLTARVCCWTNDIVSFEREKGRGDVLNLVVAFIADGFDERTALENAIYVHDSDVRAFCSATGRLQDSAAYWMGNAGGAVDGYVEHLRMYMRGNLDWMSSGPTGRGG